MQKAFPPLLMYFIRVGYDTGVLSRTCAMVGAQDLGAETFLNPPRVGPFGPEKSKLIGSRRAEQVVVMLMLCV